MKLIANIDYDVTVRMPSGVWNTFRLTYCGGSHVDPDGHYIAGGMWAKGNHPKVLYMEALTIRGITCVTRNHRGEQIPGSTYRCGCLVKRNQEFCNSHAQPLYLGK